MNRKEDTPSRIVMRAYEQKHKDERKQKMRFGEHLWTERTLSS